MASYTNANGLWDLSLPPTLPALADDEFIALLQKQFGVVTTDATKDHSVDSGNVNPQNLSRFPVQSVSPPASDDSSPSPPSHNDTTSTRSRRQSGVHTESNTRPGSRGNNDDDDQMLKRKASDDDLDDEPNAKSQHTNGQKRSLSSRRKSTGNPSVDESRLLKRKEQNRAAQRAFRERKEKHVKDLEDKLAAMEERNTATVAENESLREVITRLQSENVRLRESKFTFAVPPSSDGSRPPSSVPGVVSPADNHRDVQMPMFNSPPSATSSTTASTHDSPQSLFINDKADHAQPQLTMYGHQGLHQPQQTATSDAMGLDFGFGPVLQQTPYTTIASNPLFMSFREPDPYPMDASTSFGASQNLQSNLSANGSNGGFDFANTYTWPDVNTMDTSGLQAFDLTNSLDELFGGSYIGANGPLDFPYKTHDQSPAASLSPISHQNSNTPSSSSSSGSSPNSAVGAGSAAGPPNDGRVCPNSKKGIAKCIETGGSSAFVPKQSTPATSTVASPPVTKVLPNLEGELVPCKGLQLPKIQKNEKNVEVTSAWRLIRSDPKFQDADINDLCTQFAKKARCDGSQVVIEPDGMQEIFDAVSKNPQN